MRRLWQHSCGWPELMSNEDAKLTTDRAGTLLAERYRIVERIDAGGAGEVWLAKDERLDRDVAVKILGASADQAFKDRFAHEARRAAAVAHPNVVTVYDEGVDGSDAFMVMEYVRGQTLRELIAERGPLPANEAAGLVTQVALALDAAHAAGVIHCDVKPANVIVNESGVAKLTDFGIAVAARGEAERELVGTARYVAPERLAGEAPTARADVYGLGLVAFELLAGRPAYQGVENEDLLRDRLDRPPPSIRGARIGVSQGVDSVIARALAREPRDRYASAGGFAQSLAEAAGSMANTTRLFPVGRAAGVFAEIKRRLPPMDSALAVSAIALVLLAVVALFVAFNSAVSESNAGGTPVTSSPPARTTPNLIGMDLGEADRELKRVGWSGVRWQVDGSLRGDACSVQRQEPEAGAPVRPGQQAQVFLAPGRNCGDKLKDKDDDND